MGVQMADHWVVHWVGWRVYLMVAARAVAKAAGLELHLVGMMVV